MGQKSLIINQVVVKIKEDCRMTDNKDIKETVMAQAESESNIPKYILVTEWNKYFSYPTIGGLRALIFHADKNGFDKVIRRIPRLMICVDAYYEWIEEVNRLNKKVKMHC